MRMYMCVCVCVRAHGLWTQQLCSAMRYGLPVTDEMLRLCKHALNRECVSTLLISPTVQIIQASCDAAGIKSN